MLVNGSGSEESLKEILKDFERDGLQKKELINHNLENHNGRTAVHLAASRGHHHCLELLLISGGN